MEFFVPGCTRDEAKDFWNGARVRAEEQGHEVGARRIYRMRYRHNGREVTANVGGVDPVMRRMVYAILESFDAFILVSPALEIQPIPADRCADVEPFE